MTITVTTAPVRISADHPEWQRLKTAATALRGLQIQDGSVPEPAHHGAAASHVLAIVEAVEALAPCFPHDARYLELVCVDFTRWMEAGFGVPDFLDSLLAFRPQEHRENGLQHLVVFGQCKPNGTPSRRG